MNLTLLTLHVVVGVLFMGHGAQKLFGVLGGPGLDGLAGFFEALGLRPARLQAFVAGAAEFFGGALIALGLFTPIAAAVLIAVMVTAIVTVHFAKGPWNSDGGYEFNVLVVAALFTLAGAGPGKWSLDNALNLDLTGTGWALAALGAGVVGGLGAVALGRLGGREARSDARASAA
jgi:putative oxidoreductase